MITEHDVSYVRNQLLELLRIEEPYSQPVDLEAIEVPDTATLFSKSFWIMLCGVELFQKIH